MLLRSHKMKWKPQPGLFCLKIVSNLSGSRTVVVTTELIALRVILSVMRWLYNYDSTSVRRAFDCLSKSIKVTVT